MIVFIGDLDRAILGTGAASGAYVFFDVLGLFGQGYLEVSDFAFYPVNFSKGHDLYVVLPVDTDQLRREYSHGAVVGGEGLIQLGHLAAEGRRFIN